MILRRFNGLNIKRLNEINCHRGKASSYIVLPVRGQRTRTNARARRGSKKTVTNKKIIKVFNKIHIYKNFILAMAQTNKKRIKDKTSCIKGIVHIQSTFNNTISNNYEFSR